MIPRADDFTQKTTPTYALTASKLLLAASPSPHIDPLDPLEAILTALSSQSSLAPFLAQLAKVLSRDLPDLHEVLQSGKNLSGREQAVQTRVAELGLSEEGKRTLEKVLGLHGQAKDDDDENEADLPRNVRSL